MLLILIPIAWLAVMTVFVAVCQMAARGDAGPQGKAEEPEEPERVCDGLAVWDRPAALAMRAEGSARTGSARPRTREARVAPRAAGRRRVATHGAR